jgi:putative colanic acid biosynthesis UDP-glucose lipid carrier transferase
MVSHRTRGVYLLCVYGHLLLSQACFWTLAGAFHLHGIITLAGSDAPPHFLYSEILSIGVVLAMTFIRERNQLITSDHRLAHHFAFKQVATAYTLLLLYLAATKDTGISRLFMFSLLPALYLTLLLANAWLPGFISGQMFGGERAERILLAGSSASARRLGHWLQRKGLVGYESVGRLDEEPTGPEVLGRLRDLEAVALRHQVTQLIVTELAVPPGFLAEATGICERHGIRLLAVSDMDGQFQHPVTLLEDDGVRFFTLRDEPLENPLNRVLKRTFDLALATPVTLLILPVTHLLVWGLQRWQSPGPVYFTQTRAGMKNRPFTVYKYRSMRLDNPDETRQATANDARVFPAGRWLRKFSVDELPQFYNVLRGDMSIVGPRPHMIQHNDLFVQALKNYQVRTIARPGITGLAQVRGLRGETSTQAAIAARVNADVEYLETWSLAGDCWIVLRTVIEMFSPPKQAV